MVLWTDQNLWDESSTNTWLDLHLNADIVNFSESSFKSLNQESTRRVFMNLWYHDDAIRRWNQPAHLSAFFVFFFTILHNRLVNFSRSTENEMESRADQKRCLCEAHEWRFAGNNLRFNEVVEFSHVSSSCSIWMNYKISIYSLFFTNNIELNVLQWNLSIAMSLIESEWTRERERKIAILTLTFVLTLH